MTALEIAHAVVTVLLLTATWFALEAAGLFEGRSRLRRYAIFVPAGLVVNLVLNVFWP